MEPIYTLNKSFQLLFVTSKRFVVVYRRADGRVLPSFAKTSEQKDTKMERVFWM